MFTGKAIAGKSDFQFENITFNNILCGNLFRGEYEYKNSKYKY